MKRNLFWKLYPAFLGVIVLCLAAMAWTSFRYFANHDRASLEHELTSSARMLIATLEDGGVSLVASRVDAICKSMGRASGCRITVVLADGSVVGDSEATPLGMDNHRRRPEIHAALTTGAPGSSERFSHTLNQDMLYVALPIQRDGTVVAAARTALSLHQVEARLKRLNRHVMLTGGVIAVIALFVAMLASHAIRQPLLRLRKVSQAIAAGDLSERLAASSISEIDDLQSAMNSMASQLSDRISTITEQRDAQDALFACMREGVLAVSGDFRVARLNPAAARLLGLDAEDAKGRDIRDVMRHPELLQTIRETIEDGLSVERDIYLRSSDRHLQVSGAVMTNAASEVGGGVFVFNDVTRVRRLQSMRRDFVANVSHELRTPVTSIKGFAETLLDGTEHRPEDRDRFMGAIARQADRLQTLITDLLTLSSLEHESEEKFLDVEHVRLASVIASAVHAVSASKPEARVKTVCAEDLCVSLNFGFVEYAIINLLDNAIKYGGESGAVVVSAETQGDDVVIRVQDKGPGIANEHLSRLFERFYRVDKGRSRKLGGTGLGLAIVKRIALAHGGRVSVESTLGKGSTFSLLLPNRDRPNPEGATTT
ncbi:MAG: two-component system phosphate regulon sensor histidine kinase PhoR [Candidatus Promineifilaceae bacterium]|jgi:two-component system phosphate regulon sensor histidine kinase PhoR